MRIIEDRIFRARSIRTTALCMLEGSTVALDPRIVTRTPRRLMARIVT